MTLQEWFDEKDYGIGLALFGQHSKNRILYQNLSRKQNPEKLEYELRKIAEHQGVDFTGNEEGAKVIQLVPEATAPTEDDKQKKLDEFELEADDIVSDKLNQLEDNAEQVVVDTTIELERISNEIISGKLKIIRDGKEIDFDTLSPEMKARWEQNRDNYKEQRVLHEKLKLMANATPEDRQPLTQRMCDLDNQIRVNWEEIDAYVPGANNGEPPTAIDHKRLQANRKYISTNLKKLPEQTNPVKAAQVVAELQKRFDEIKTSGEAVAPETIEELTKAGVTC